jgi:integrase/recombinase XerD
MKEIEKIFKGFLIHCQYEKNLSNKTIRAYSGDLGQFTECLKN